MKRIHISAPGICLLVLFTLFHNYALGEMGQEKNSLFVYICGSNLESEYGSASEDLREMIEASSELKDTNLLVMTGGSDFSSPSGYFSSRNNKILEISKGKIRQVWQSEELMSMGDPETLETFLKYGRSNYPADNYALILWDHGGGPLEGICWDEVYHNEHLNLGGIVEAFNYGLNGQKLSWIGFDACLMSSLEVACKLSDYADYMIASQETEPAFGWNYSFLREIDQFSDGQECGKHIVDWFFDGKESYRDVMTLSCIDLGKMDSLIAEMDLFFSNLVKDVSEERFPELSNIRKQTPSFGLPVRGTDNLVYDLVDANSLIETLGTHLNYDTDSLLQALKNTVCYNKSNVPGASGLSIYHPLANKERYKQEWRRVYINSEFSLEYTKYINEFGKILLGESLVDWKGIAVQEKTPGETFTLQLTPEQAATYSSAQLIILHDIHNRSQLSDGCAISFTSLAQIDENNNVIANYNGKSLYIEEENGDIYGPIAYNITEDGQNAYIPMTYLKDNSTKDKVTVLYYFSPSGEDQYPEITRTRVWDEATRTYTNRILFDESKYQIAHLFETGRKLPSDSVRGYLPDYNEWEDGSYTFPGFEMRLPNKWRFRWIDQQQSGKQLFAAIQITDSQQNTYCTMPIPVSNSYKHSYEAKPETNPEKDMSFILKVNLVESPMNQYVKFSLQIDDHSRKLNRNDFTASLPEINGERASNAHLLASSVDSGILMEGSMGREELYGLDIINTVSMTVTFINQERKEIDIPLDFHFDPIQVKHMWEDIVPLGSAENEKASIILLALDPVDTNVAATMLIRNSSADELSLLNQVTIQGIDIRSSSVKIASGKSTLASVVLYNNISIGGWDIKTIVENPLFYQTYVLDHLLQHNGIVSIDELSFYMYLDDRETTDKFKEEFKIQLREPWVLYDRTEGTDLNTSMKVVNPDEIPDSPLETVPFLENNQYSVSYGQALKGKNGIAVVLKLENHTDQQLRIKIDHVQINNEYQSYEYGDWLVAPKSTKYDALVISESKLSDSEITISQINEISFQISSTAQKRQLAGENICNFTFLEPLILKEYRPEWFTLSKVSFSIQNEAKEIDISLENKSEYSDIIFSNDVICPEKKDNYVKWIEAELDEERESKVRNGGVFIVRDHGTTVEVISFQLLTKGSNGHLGCYMPTLYCCIEEEQSSIIPWQAESVEENEIHFNTIVGILAGNPNPIRTIESMKINYNQFENKAEIKIEESGTEKINRVYITSWNKIKPIITERDKPFLEWKTYSPFNEIEPCGDPLHIMIKPFTNKDHLYAIFSLVQTDDYQYSLPMMPLNFD